MIVINLSAKVLLSLGPEAAVQTATWGATISARRLSTAAAGRRRDTSAAAAGRWGVATAVTRAG
jgi:hypothetical protein